MNSLPKENGTPRRRLCRWIALAMCLIATTIPTYQAYKFQPSPTDQQIAKAEDEVYEAVLRDILHKLDQNRGIRLVFDDNVLVGDVPWLDAESCKTAPALSVQVTEEQSPNSGTPASTPSLEVVESYRKIRCVGGRLSRTFHTDVPYSFVGDLSSDWVLPSAEDPKFARLFPGASGVFGFTHAGFNKQLDEAIVSTSFVCGGLCGGGHRYFLKKVGGGWKVVSERMIWVS